MLTELAHYALLFAAALVGLQTILLTPTLWGKGSAVAVRLGFRGQIFAVSVMFVAFAILAYDFAVRDFSVAVVFENFDTRAPLVSVLPALLMSREGYFFVWILTVTLAGLAGFSKITLGTYQERGRYLFIFDAVTSFLLFLMIGTADPFERIVDPPLEGLGLKPVAAWFPFAADRLCLFAVYALLSTAAVRSLCRLSKKADFALPAIRLVQTALVFAVAAAACEFAAHALRPEDGAFFGWLPNAVLETAVVFVTAGQLLLLYFNAFSGVFGKAALIYGLTALTLLSASFFGTEYQVFTLSAEEIYFPNPLTAAYGVLGLICVYLFSLTPLKMRIGREPGFALLSRESLISFAAASCLACGISIGLTALIPAAFMFAPDMPLRLLPDMVVKVILFYTFLATFFLSAAFLRKPVSGGWTRLYPVRILLPWTAAGLCFVLFAKETERSLLYEIPVLCCLTIVLNFMPFRTPKDLRSAFSALRRIPFFFYGLILLLAAIGGLIAFRKDLHLTMKALAIAGTGLILMTMGLASEKENKTP